MQAGGVFFSFMYDILWSIPPDMRTSCCPADKTNQNVRRFFMFRKVKAVFGVALAALLASGLLLTGCKDSPDEPGDDNGGGYNFCC